ncbi:Rrf2 family transcriptional regulator [Patescibacteria group bacterium]|nr:Rrf2 family transcriptional regulator [Patescibacteria group bacterium]
MIRISTKSLYGLRAMIYLAKKDQVSSTAAISQSEKISYEYLEKILQELKGAGLIMSKRGVEGGYYLAGKPKSITVGAIVRALDGSLSPVKCIDEATHKKCPEESACDSKMVWQKLYDAMNDMLDALSLADLAKGGVQSKRKKTPCTKK